MKRMLLGTTAVGLCAVAGLLPAHAANVADGTLYEVTSAVAADVTNFAPTSKFVSFSAPSEPLFFSSCSGGVAGMPCPTGSNPTAAYTIGPWLASGGATVGTPQGGLALTDSMDNTAVEFSGSVTVTHDDKFTFAHDDGVILTIGTQKVIDAPLETAPTVSTGTFTGAAGNYTFTLVYGECCGPPSVLDINLPFTPPAHVPEPATLVLLGTGLVGLGFMRHRKRR